MQNFCMLTTKTLNRLNAHADLGLSWAHISKGTISHVEAHFFGLNYPLAQRSCGGGTGFVPYVSTYIRT